MGCIFPVYSMRPSLENTSDPDEIRELALLVIRNKHKITQQKKIISTTSIAERFS